MKKSEAIELLGGTPSSASRALGITSSAVSQWPDEVELPRAIEDRVLAHLWRKKQAEANSANGTTSEANAA